MATYDFETDFSGLAKLPQIYKQAQSERLLSDLGKGLAEGTIDYRQAAGLAAQSGNPNLSLALLQKADERAAFEKYSPLIGGGLPQQPPPMAQPHQPASSMMPAQANADVPAPSRAAVQPSARVWGDKEAEAAGLYPPSGGAQPRQTIAQAPAPPAPPQQPVQRPTQPQGPGFDPRLNQILVAISDPNTPASQRQALSMVAQRLMPEDNKIMQLPDGTILAVNARTNQTIPIYQASKPTFGVIGKDQSGNDVHGFIDVTTKKVMDITGNPIDTSKLTGVGQPGSTLTGDDFLKTLDQGRANQIKAIVEGRQAPPGGMALKSPQVQAWLRDAAQYEPGFDLTVWTTRNKTRADMATGKMGQNITAFNTAIGHLGTLDKAADALNNSSLPAYNTVANYLAQATGDPRVNAFHTAKTAVIDELTRAFRGTGGNVYDLMQWEKAINSSGSPQQLKATVRQAVELLRSRIEAVGEQASRGMGKPIDATSLLSSKAQETIKQLSGENAAGSFSDRFGSPASGNVVKPGKYIWDPQKGLVGQ